MYINASCRQILDMQLSNVELENYSDRICSTQENNRSGLHLLFLQVINYACKCKRNVSINLLGTCSSVLGSSS